MEIILVRHGKARKQEENQRDLDRELNKRGRRQLEELKDYILDNTNESHTIKIWTSPAVRTKQTAEIIAQHLQIDELMMGDFIWEGDFNVFRGEVAQENMETTIFVVGHEPDMSNWAKIISGKELIFRPGTMASFKVDGFNPLSATFQWQYPEEIPKIYSKKAYRDVMLSLLEKLPGLHHDFLERPDDVESVHQFRVQLRTLRALLFFVKPLLSDNEYQKNKNCLKSISDHFGPVRERDVILKLWHKEHSKDSNLSRILNQERQAEKYNLLVYAGTEEIPQNIDGVKNWLSEWEDDMSSKEFTRFAKERFKSWQEKVTRLIHKIDTNDFDSIHNTRIQFKKLRYIKAHIPLFKNDDSLDLEELKGVQDVLGDITDLYVNLELLNKLKQKYNDPGLLEEINDFRTDLKNQRKKLLKEAKQLLEPYV